MQFKFAVIPFAAILALEIYCRLNQFWSRLKIKTRIKRANIKVFAR